MNRNDPLPSCSEGEEKQASRRQLLRDGSSWLPRSEILNDTWTFPEAQPIAGAADAPARAA